MHARVPAEERDAHTAQVEKELRVLEEGEQVMPLDDEPVRVHA